MIRHLKGISRDKFWDYFILVSRFLIGWTFLHYGYSKITEGQFGVSDAEMQTQLKDLDLFRLSWYLFDHQPFQAFIGISQIICGSLLIINRTAIIGAFFFLPIVATILIIDLTFMPIGLKTDFAFRLSGYIILDLLILWYYKDRMLIIWNAVWQSINTKYKFPVWAYLLLPVLAIGLEIVLTFPKMITFFILHPERTIKSWGKIPEFVVNVFKKAIE